MLDVKVVGCQLGCWTGTQLQSKDNIFALGQKLPSEHRTYNAPAKTTTTKTRSGAKWQAKPQVLLETVLSYKG